MEEVQIEYSKNLKDLKFNSKPVINLLTLLAEDYIKYGHIVVQEIEKHINTVKLEMKLPTLYLLDSIIKNVKKDYIELFTENIVTIFYGIFEKVDERTRKKMFKLRMTWNEIFPSRKLYQIDVKCHQIDRAWPILNSSSITITKGSNLSNGTGQNRKIKEIQISSTPAADIVNSLDHSSHSLSNNTNIKKELSTFNTSKKDLDEKSEIKVIKEIQPNFKEDVDMRSQKDVDLRKINRKTKSNEKSEGPSNSKKSKNGLEILEDKDLHQSQSQQPQPQIDVNDILAKLFNKNKENDKNKKDSNSKKVEEKFKDNSTPPLPPPVPLPVIEIKWTDLKIKNDALIHRMTKGLQFQCSTCGLRFASQQNSIYSRHLDWHFRNNRKEKANSKKAQSRQWYYGLSDWIQFEEVEDLEERATCIFEAQDSKSEALDNVRSPQRETVLNPDSYTVLASEHKEATCPQCGEEFETFFDEDLEEWRLRNAFIGELLGNKKLFHPLCHQDFLYSSAEEISENKSGESDNLNNYIEDNSPLLTANTSSNDPNSPLEFSSSIASTDQKLDPNSEEFLKIHKPRLYGRKLNNQPPKKTGKEISGLCSIC